MITRAISGIILVALALLVVLTGGTALLATLMILSIIGVFELLRCLKLEKSSLGIAAYLAVVCYYLLLYFNKTEYTLFFIVSTMIVLFFVYVLSYPKYQSEQISMTLLSVIYVAVLFSYMYQTRCLENGKFLVWLIFVAAWGSDTFAYIFGVLLGKHKLPSELSPKKTIEGCIGGIFGATFIGFILAWFYPESQNTFTIDAKIVFPLIGAVGSVISQFGDLTASAIKRNHSIKDYGKLIPGHGGIMDRFDSILFISPVVYYILYFVSLR